MEPFAHLFRYNLDPFSIHSNEELWEALEKTYLKDYVRFIKFMQFRQLY